MIKTFRESMREQRRLVMLRLLSEQPGYASNSSILHAGLVAYGVPSSRDDVQTDLAWLQDQGLVSLELVPDAAALSVVRLTQRGDDAAKGLTVVPGVRRPSPH